MRPITLIFLVSLVSLATPALAAQKSVKKTSSPPTTASKALLDAWYTVKANGKVPFGYYNDHVEMRGNRLFYQNHYWKREEDYINEEQLGSYAEASPELQPLFFNYHMTYRASEISVDGTVSEGRKFSARVRKGEEELPIIKRTIPEHTIFTSFFPVWLQMKTQGMKPGDSARFQSILEDSWEQSYPIVPGRIRAEKPDEIAARTGTRRFTVEYRDMKSTWWLDDKGVATRIEMPQQGFLVERVKGEEEARKFLE